MRNSKKLALIFAAAIMLGGKLFAQENEAQNENSSPFVNPIEESRISDNSSILDKISLSKGMEANIILEEIKYSFEAAKYMREIVWADIEQAAAISKAIELEETGSLVDVYNEYLTFANEEIINLTKNVYEFMINNDQPLDNTILAQNLGMLEYCLSNVPGCDLSSFDESGEKTHDEVVTEFKEAIGNTRIINVICSYERIKRNVHSSGEIDYITSIELDDYNQNISDLIESCGGDFSILDSSGNMSSDEMWLEYYTTMTDAYLLNAKAKMEDYNNPPQYNPPLPPIDWGKITTQPSLSI